MILYVTLQKGMDLKHLKNLFSQNGKYFIKHMRNYKSLHLLSIWNLLVID